MFALGSSSGLRVDFLLEARNTIAADAFECSSFERAASPDGPGIVCDSCFEDASAFEDVGPSETASDFVGADFVFG